MVHTSRSPRSLNSYLLLLIGIVGCLFVATMAVIVVSTAPVIDPRCALPEHRFPEWADTEGKVEAVVKELFPGWRYTGNPYLRGAGTPYVYAPDASVAGWIGATLANERRGLVLPSLRDHVRAEGDVRRVFPQSSWRPVAARKTVPTATWQELRDLPDTTCVGAMLRNPSNAKLVRLIETAVGDAAR